MKAVKKGRPGSGLRIIEQKYCPQSTCQGRTAGTGAGPVAGWATAAGGAAHFVGVTAWAGELGYGVRAAEATQAEADKASEPARDVTARRDSGSQADGAPPSDAAGGGQH